MKDKSKIIFFLPTIFVILTLEVISLATPEWAYLDIKYEKDSENIVKATLGLWKICLKESNISNCYDFPSPDWNDLVHDADGPKSPAIIEATRWILTSVIPFLVASGLLPIWNHYKAFSWVFLSAGRYPCTKY